jgi:BolA protein
MIEIIRERLSALAPTHLEIIDDSHKHIGHAGNTGGGHYTIVISSPQFSGLTRIEQHRKIYACLDDFIPEKIHAVAIQIR